MNLIYMSKLTKDNRGYFKFHSNNCFVKFWASNRVLLERFLHEIGLYCFNNLPVESSRNNLSCNPEALLPFVHNIVVSNKTPNSVNANSLLANKMFIWHTRLGHVNPRPYIWSFKCVIFHSIIKSHLIFVTHVVLENHIGYLHHCPLPNILFYLNLYIMTYGDPLLHHLGMDTPTTLHLYMPFSGTHGYICSSIRVMWLRHSSYFRAMWLYNSLTRANQCSQTLEENSGHSQGFLISKEYCIGKLVLTLLIIMELWRLSIDKL